MLARILLIAILIALPAYSSGQSSAVAYYNKGIEYYNKKDYPKAIAYFRKAAEMGYSKAVSLVGQSYYRAGDYPQAIAWLQKPAEKGDADAQLTLAYAYDKLEEYAKALPWFRKAADRGEAYAQFYLGSYYFEGKGTGKDYQEAERWYRKALRNPKGMKSGNNISIINKHLEEINMLFHSTGYILTRPPYVSKHTDVLQVSQYFDESIRLRTEGSNIIIEYLPDNDRWNYVMLSLFSATDRDFNKTVYPGRQTVVYPIGHMPDGYYYCELYTSNIRNSTFQSYIYGKDLMIYKRKNSVVFLQSPVFDHNLRLYRANRSDRRALELYLQATEELPANEPGIIALANKITRGAGNDYGKAKAIHDWVCNNIWYDWDSFRSGNIKGVSTIGTINSRKSVCEGYARVTATLLRAVGIPAKKISGFALGVSSNKSGWTADNINSSESNHAWNEAFIDGEWIIIDTTWDSSNKFEKGRFSTGTGLKGCRYFDATLAMFSMDHKILESADALE
ncbi:MAG: tetratricopeptide repeat protein [Tannerellaceae bacterium]|jgi:tetratricopeptide (TPR) repeat protein|nr:tetratricopeptide repeat protein [Tannerellaceae bacterium]